MPFEPITPLGTEIAENAPSLPLDTMQLIQIGVLAVVALILGLFVVRPILAPGRQLAGPDVLPALTDDSEPPAFEMATASFDTMGEMGVMDDFEEEDPVARLRQMISERETETIQILQDWIEDPAPQENV